MKIYNMDDNIPLNQEWKILHHDHEKYEHYALLIKLLAVVISFFGVITTTNFLLTVGFVSILWFQEGIWKTFQARTANRILEIEQAINKNDKLTAFNFYINWEKTRPGAVKLVIEYIKNALRPTVLFIYLALFFLLFISRIIS